MQMAQLGRKASARPRLVRSSLGSQRVEQMSQKKVDLNVVRKVERLGDQGEGRSAVLHL